MINKTQLQIEFEASCFMHEVNASNELRESIKVLTIETMQKLPKEERNTILKNIPVEKTILIVPEKIICKISKGV